ncbi:hypothetical protein GCM10010121_086760 [Streptomyces brasiliensis]|uniref:Uncharacterized protein n=1 Tax=Streptomyces brasiliensis TaxID=1954 RepID=A0A917UKB0_9ACTN|nr:hypothetical protein GCM10010121_086760 [Streptomyces brasiliensis]
MSWMVPGSWSFQTCMVRAAQATAAPSAANARAGSAPMPRLAPVTMATRPANRPASSWGLVSETVLGAMRYVLHVSGGFVYGRCAAVSHRWDERCSPTGADSVKVFN